MRNVRTRLFAALRSSFARLANLERYVVISRSRAIATTAMTNKLRTCENVIPNTLDSPVFADMIQHHSPELEWRVYNSFALIHERY
jgi:hypothetical protein